MGRHRRGEQGEAEHGQKGTDQWSHKPAPDLGIHVIRSAPVPVGPPKLCSIGTGI
jgi:hypothetical protein